jgi:copper chaperone NosL
MKTLIFNTLIIFTLSLIGMACAIETEPINYGSDLCSFCKMTIIDKKYGTELVTSKGKVFKFDDVSCMVKYMKSSGMEESNYKHIVLSSFDKSGELIPVKKAFFVKSEKLQSPMQGNVAAFNTELEAKKFIKSDTTSKSMVWTELKNIF